MFENQKGMEKVCEFCTDLRPLVYCKADAAYLCLSCDSKVHFANALSSRHLRTLVCNSCRYHLAYVQCLDHKILICQECDQKLHDVSLPHRKRAIRSFMGCPSAKDFAMLWCFGLNEMENITCEDLFGSASCVSADSNMAQASVRARSRISSKAKLHGGSSSRQGQILYSDQERKKILQQIIDLKQLQLNENTDQTIKINGPEEETDLTSSAYQTIKKSDEKFNKQEQNSKDVLEKDSHTVELNPEPLPSTFSQLDNLPSIVDLPLHGELFWTGKSPPRSNQLWSQNIQDLGICEELVCRDDFNIPDVDLTFQNFEELFGDQDPVRALLDDNDVSCSSLEKDMSIDKSDIDNLSAIEDSSAARSITILQSAHENKDIDSTNIQHYPRSTDPPHTIRPFESTVSSSVSRFWAASNPTYHNDGALSPCSEEKGYLGNSAELEISHMEATQNLTLMYEENPSRRNEKQVRLPSGKPGANVRKKVKGTAKAESY
ncbi:putative zinc finger protein At1g68190 isoform X1 [Arachis stenosperma]|uniref:putative zinc finger protein At1g68190 isoform X1 n=2 Tax=Arachis stenosperma TaxID=217475 RepID=UPI0025ABDB22|nr:putative zinc finger protein At1g68190 isoform X1 [Arachis stenosperma]XP_057732974.1 putative zinc finger protein At1g68190 isoform X1 [Arachis stenosperma]XP_057732975.1 putative zinc finger protein At1g68190 isoform X1 [Arachis stenosperma]XP_057732976.1 putative zinc finger protein At1g68190 isoform X1 [Arachis stenosperma]